MESHGRKNRRLLISALILAIYSAALVLLLTRHENWRDEGQAWLLARDLDFWGLIHQMRYEGHPCLWHLLLMPLAKSGMPYITMNVLSVTLLLCAVALMLWKSPVPLPIQAAILLSAPFLYLLPIISRSYSLIPILLFCNAVVYPYRARHPLVYGLTIALLVQTHIMMLGMAGAISLIWLGEAITAYRRDHNAKALSRQAAGLCLPLISLVFLLIQLYASSESSAYPSASMMEPHTLLAHVREILSRSFKMPSSLLSKLMFLLFILALLAVLVLSFTRGEALKPLLIFLAGSGVMLLLLAFAKRYATQKLAAFLPMLVWLLWVDWPQVKNRLHQAALCLMVLSLCLPMICQNRNTTLADWKYPYSYSKNCATYLEQNVPRNSEIIVGTDYLAASLLPYMSRKSLLDSKSGEPISYTTWIDREPVMSNLKETRAWLMHNQPEAETAWLVLDDNYSVSDDEAGVTLVYKTMDRDHVGWEKFHVYRVDLQ